MCWSFSVVSLWGIVNTPDGRGTRGRAECSYDIGEGGGADNRLGQHFIAEFSSIY